MHTPCRSSRRRRFRRRSRRLSSRGCRRSMWSRLSVFSLSRRMPRRSTLRLTPIPLLQTRIESLLRSRCPRTACALPTPPILVIHPPRLLLIFPPPLLLHLPLLRPQLPPILLHLLLTQILLQILLIPPLKPLPQLQPRPLLRPISPPLLPSPTSHRIPLQIQIIIPLPLPPPHPHPPHLLQTRLIRNPRPPLSKHPLQRLHPLLLTFLRPRNNLPHNIDFSFFVARKTLEGDFDAVLRWCDGGAEERVAGGKAEVRDVGA